MNEKTNSTFQILFSFLMFTSYMYSNLSEFIKQLNEVVFEGYKHTIVTSNDGLYIKRSKSQEQIKDIIRGYEYLKSGGNLPDSNIVVFNLKVIDVKPVCLFKCNWFKIKNLYRYYVKLTIVDHDFQFMKSDDSVINFVIKPNISYIYSYVKHIIKETDYGYPFWFKREEFEKISKL